MMEGCVKGSFMHGPAENETAEKNTAEFGTLE